MKLLVMTILASCVISGCTSLKEFIGLSEEYKWGDKLEIAPDSPLEELGEDILEHFTGVDIDITPGSKE